MGSERLGVEGLHFRLPEGWAASSMEKLSDGLTVEVSDERGALRMVIRTSPFKGLAVDTKKALKGLARRLGRDAVLDTDPKIPGLRKPLKRLPDLTVFSFKEAGDAEGCGFIAQRMERKEALLAVAFRHEDPDFSRIVEALTSLSEDPYQADQIWEAGGVSISLPSAFHFSSYRYDRRGYMRLVLADARSELALERFSGAAVLLEQMGNLSRIWVEAARKDIARFELTKERETEHPHPGIFFRRDVSSGAFRKFKAFLRRSLPFGKPYFLSGFLWHCEPSNRIIGIKAAARRPEDADAVRELAERVRCCGRAAD